MFMLYALPLGLLGGWLSGGRLAGLGAVSLRWAPLALIGLLVQVALFFEPVADRVGVWGTPVYIGSSVLVLGVVVRNLRVPGLPLVAAGAGANLLAIAANGGHMPASPAAMAALGKTVGNGYSNSMIVSEPRLAPLTDVFALPAGLPFANVFSIGDVAIAVGVAWAIAAAMRRGGASRNLVPRAHATGTDGP